MSCFVAVSSSPVFSPSSSLFYSKISSSPETLALSHLSSSPSPLSPSSSFRLRKQSSGLSGSPATSVLKRKRPARLEIPLDLGLSFAPAEERGKEEVEDEREACFSVYCKKGRREAMEDRYSAVLDIQADPKQAFFGIFDGHGGAKAAQFASEKLDKNIMDEVIRREEDEIEEAVKRGYLNTDSDVLKEDFRGGSCCVTALIRKGSLVVSNAGDCRAVLSRGGVAEALTSDHKPSREDERKRIENLDGYVDLNHGAWRVQGSLAVSRAIGDRHLKKWVIAEPETKVVRIEPKCEFLILASDGLWDKVSNQEAVDIARSLCVGIDKPEPLVACKKLADLSVSRGTTDDTSVLLIQLGSYVW